MAKRQEDCGNRGTGTIYSSKKENGGHFFNRKKTARMWIMTIDDDDDGSSVDKDILELKRSESSGYYTSQ